MKSMTNSKELTPWIASITRHFLNGEVPYVEAHPSFIKNPKLIYELIDKIQSLEEDGPVELEHEYSAYFLAFDICIAEIKTGVEAENKLAQKALANLMDYLAKTMYEKKHGLGFYLPLLNAFYEGRVELTEELQQAYFEIAEKEDLTIEDFD